MEIKELLDEICDKDPLEMNEEFIQNICEKIDNYYNESETKRHSYSDIASYVYEIKKDDYEYIIGNLECIYEFYKRKDDNDGRIRIFKLIDHIKLETNRTHGITQIYLSKVSEEISQLVQTSLKKSIDLIDSKEKDFKETIGKQEIEMKRQFEKHTSEIDKINSNLISVLGIFGAIIVAFFGGLNLLGSVLQNMHSVSIYRLVFISIIMIMGLFNIIFLLLYCISKLTQKNLWSNCRECMDCSAQNNKIECLYSKYPLVIIYNMISSWALVTILIMYFVDKYDVIKNIIFILGFNLDNGIITVIMGALVICILEFIFITLVKSRYKKIKLKINCKS